MTPDDGATDQLRADAISDLEREISLLFRRSRRLSARLARTIHPGLDGPEYVLLGTIAQLDPDGAGLRAATLSERTRQHKSTLSRSLSELEQLGLVARVPDPDDARARLITLTDAGRSTMDQARAGRREHMLQRLHDWDAEDLVRLADLLGNFSRAIGVDPPEA